MVTAWATRKTTKCDGMNQAEFQTFAILVPPSSRLRGFSGFDVVFGLSGGGFLIAHREPMGFYCSQQSN
jgi:hypothetical protein